MAYQSPPKSSSAAAAAFSSSSFFASASASASAAALAFASASMRASSSAASRAASAAAAASAGSASSFVSTFFGADFCLISWIKSRSKSSLETRYSLAEIPFAFELSLCVKNIFSTWSAKSMSGNRMGFSFGAARALAAVSLTLDRSSFHRATISSIRDGRYVRTKKAASGRRLVAINKSAHASTLEVRKLATNATFVFPPSVASLASFSIPSRFPVAVYNKRRPEKSLLAMLAASQSSRLVTFSAESLSFFHFAMVSVLSLSSSGVWFKRARASSI
mmetsp:Transcript_5126/g.11479  ORF Transcript_5126/g.11479 Transcript_5126/m.11479 type:complete len:277 (-) Transcript_5126:2063-2893(-)